MTQTFDLAIRPFTASHPPSTSSCPPSSAIPLPARPSFPIACLNEAQYSQRYTLIKEVEKSIQILQPDFRVRVEHLAIFLLLSIKDLQKDGYFSHETSIPHELQERLVDIAPFCKHYMLHLDPDNINPESRQKFENWCHAIPELPLPQPRLNPKMGPDQVVKSMHYNSCFKTRDSIDDLPPDFDEQEESRCRVRDGNQCVLTGRPYPRVFWFIPRGWNDTTDHNNATGNFEAGCLFLTHIDLFEDIHSSIQLGKTHQAWNMLCIDPIIYDLLVRGLCAFCYDGKKRTLPNGEVKVQLKFFWMPSLDGRFNQVMDLNRINQCEPLKTSDGSTAFCRDEEGYELSLDLDRFWRRNCPPTEYCRQQVTAIGFPQLSSGYEIWIELPAQESRLLESVVKIHWNCIMFTALCGGAGRAWFLTGMNHQDGSLQPMDTKFEDEKEGMEEASGQLVLYKR